MTRTELWDKFWKDRHGKVVIWQSPNALLWLWIISTIATKILHGGRPEHFSDALAFGSLFAWAWLEMTEGVNYFRRTLGAVILLLILMSKIK